MSDASNHLKKSKDYPIQIKNQRMETYKLSSVRSKSQIDFNEDANNEMYERTLKDVLHSKS